MRKKREKPDPFSTFEVLRGPCYKCQKDPRYANDCTTYKVIWRPEPHLAAEMQCKNGHHHKFLAIPDLYQLMEQNAIPRPPKVDNSVARRSRLLANRN